MDKKEIFEMPIPIGCYVYDTDLPTLAQDVIGYRIGRMIGEDLEDYEDDGYEDGVWYIQYGMGMVWSSSPVAEIGVSLFCTRDEAMRAAGRRRDAEW